MAVQHLVLGEPLGPRRHHILLPDLLEERVLGEEGRGGEGRERHGEHRQHEMPEIVDDPHRPGELVPILRDEPAQREDLQERAAGEQHDEEHGDEEAGDRIADHDHRARPYVEARAVHDRLADAERNRDGVGEQRHPQPERDRHRHSLLDQLEHARVAEIALAEIEQEIVLDHHAEAHIGRLVEAELLLQALDELGVEPLRAAIFGRRRDIARQAALAWPRPCRIAAAAAEHRGGAGIGARQLGDEALDRSARRELHDDEGHQHDAEHGRDDEQDAAKDIGGHCGRVGLLERTTR